jgi:hypothetical protein
MTNHRAPHQQISVSSFQLCISDKSETSSAATVASGKMLYVKRKCHTLSHC